MENIVGTVKAQKYRSWCSVVDNTLDLEPVETIYVL